MPSKNKIIVENWKNSVASLVNEKPANKVTTKNEDDRINCIKDNHFTKFFDDTTLNQNDYIFSQLTDQSATGRGTITKSKSWIWPNFSGFLKEWTNTANISGSKLHSITGEFLDGHLLDGITHFKYSNGVTVSVKIKSGIID